MVRTLAILLLAIRKHREPQTWLKCPLETSHGMWDDHSVFSTQGLGQAHQPKMAKTMVIAPMTSICEKIMQNMAYLTVPEIYSADFAFVNRG